MHQKSKQITIHLATYIYSLQCMCIICIICKWCKWLFRLNARHTCINKYTIKRNAVKWSYFFILSLQPTKYPLCPRSFIPTSLFSSRFDCNCTSFFKSYYRTDNNIVRNFILCELCHTEYINHEENLTFNILSRMHTTYVTEYA